MFRFLVACCCFLFAAFNASATDTTRVLYIGNSFIFTYDVPALVSGLAAADGRHIVYQQHTPGGITVGDTAQGTQAHMNNPAVFSLIRQGGWDYVVLQDNQGRFVRNYGNFPGSSKVVEGHKKIRDSVHHYNPCARMLWFSGWAFKNGSPPYGNTGAEMIDRIWANYRYLNDSLPEIILPIGPAWKAAMAAVPGTDLWGPDEAHQSLAGSYVTAATIAATIFRKDISSLNYNGGLPATTAQTYRSLASATVRDSMALSFGEYYLPLAHTGNVWSTDPGYSSYEWYMDDSLISSGTANGLIVSAPGCFQVAATGADGCKLWSWTHCVNATSISDPGRVVSVGPNPFRDQLSIGLSSAARRHLALCDLTGKAVIAFETSGVSVTIPTGELPPGVYLLRVTEDGAHHSVKLVHE